MEHRQDNFLPRQTASLSITCQASTRPVGFGSRDRFRADDFLFLRLPDSLPFVSPPLMLGGIRALHKIYEVLALACDVRDGHDDHTKADRGAMLSALSAQA